MNSTKQLVKKLTKLVSDLIDSMQKAYAEFSVQFLVERDYLQKVIMTLVAPVGLQEQPALQELPYFTFVTSYDQQLALKSGKWEGYSGLKYNQDSDVKNEAKSEVKQFNYNGLTQPVQTGGYGYQDSERNGDNITKQEPSKLEVSSFQRKEACQNQNPGAGILVGSCRNKNMVYGVHPTAIALKKDQEIGLCEWVKARYAEGRAVSRIAIRKKARKILASKYFQATEGWLRRFIHRHPEIKQYIGCKNEELEVYSDYSQGSQDWKLQKPKAKQITRAQFHNLMREEGLKISPEELNEHFVVLDPDNTGYISAEAIALLKSKVEEPERES